MNEPDMTKRKQIIEMLKNGPVSYMTIANTLKTSLKELKEDLQHVERSVNMKMVPARCKKCNFEFDSDRRYKTPTKCPRCKEERIESQKFWI